MAALKLLVTGFGPFPGVRVNPTERLARELARSSRFRRLGVAVVAALFETRWETPWSELPSVLAREAPDGVLHLGVAAGRRFIAVETLARPTAAVFAFDAGGASAPRASDAARPLAIAAFPAPILAAVRQSGAPARLSNDAGRYLCNALYHESLRLRAVEKRLRPTLFIHVPLPGAQLFIPAARLRSRPPGKVATLRALEAALLALARQARIYRATAERPARAL